MSEYEILLAIPDADQAVLHQATAIIEESDGLAVAGSVVARIPRPVVSASLHGPRCAPPRLCRRTGQCRAE